MTFQGKKGNSELLKLTRKLVRPSKSLYSNIAFTEQKAQKQSSRCSAIIVALTKWGKVQNGGKIAPNFYCISLFSWPGLESA